MSRTLASLQFGEWVYRQRRADGQTIALRLYQAIDELSRILPANEYPCRHAIALKLATGEPLEAGQYAYCLTDPE